MAKFNTRVELRDLSSANHRDTYDRLHAAMERAGFERFIVAGDGTKYHLPHAEYNKASTQTCEQVLDQAKAIADSVHKPNGVITWEYSQAAWNGLLRV